MRGLVTPMRPLLLATCVALAVATPARAASLLFDYVGFDYESPNPNAATFGELGSGYVGLGTVPFLFAPLVSNTAVNEYTFVIDGLSPTSITPIGTSNVIAYSTGTLTIYEDPTAGGTTATFAPNPPNPTVPSSFTDGTPILVGSLTNFQFVVDTATGTGYFEAVLTVTGGTQLGNFPLDQRTGWTFSGSTSNALNIPPGYAHQLDGQAFLNSATATRHASWGQLKAGYR
jgi:hypothetical protein